MVWVVVPAVLAPFWTFPALLKVVLLMGVNAIVIPLVMLVVILLVNRSDIMGEHKAGLLGNLTLFAGLILSIWLSIEKLPGYLSAVVG